MTRGERVIRFIERYCIVPEGKLVGKPMRLDPFQKRFVLAVYDNPAGTRKAILSLGRKNGKTGLIAGILLAHLVGPEAKLNSQIVSGAMSRDQAGLVFKLASKMVRLSSELRKLVRIVPSSKELIGLPLSVEFRALSAEGTTAHGLSPVLSLLDEVGQVRGPRSEFIDAITTAQGAHEEPLLIVISTQAAHDSDLLSLWIDDALLSHDPHTICHLYTAPAACDLMDEQVWLAANPALGSFRSRKDVEEQAKQAKRMPSAENTFRNLVLNQRVSTISPFISLDVWKLCGGQVLPFGEAKVYAGLDLSARTDLTAFVLAAKIAGIWHIQPHFWTPEAGLKERAKRDRTPYDVWAKQGWLHTTPGSTVDYDYIVGDIAAITQNLNIKTVAFDRWRVDLFKKALDDAGVTLDLVPHGQGFKDMSPAIDALEAELLNGRVAHGMHPVLTMCAANAVVVRDAAGNRKLDKQKATGRIDGLVALAMAIGQHGAEPVEPEPQYQMLIL